MVTISLLYFLTENQATATHSPLCLHPRASMSIASVHHQWIAHPLVGSRGIKGWSRGLPHARPWRCWPRVCLQAMACTTDCPVYGQRAVPLGCQGLDCPTGAPLEQLWTSNNPTEPGLPVPYAREGGSHGLVQSSWPLSRHGRQRSAPSWRR